ncbi:MAG: phosphoglycerate kinase [Candidatus Hecatellales archaeon ex4484_218]|nr:MAG: phosphoglycerate kinase [Candidatus Hecatellales archaeon ex4484_218]
MVGEEFLTLDDVKVEGKTVFVRFDFNSPIDPSTGKILDDSRIRSALPTLKVLEKAKVVVGSHQGRPGDEDFTTLKNHAKILGEYVGEGKVRFVEDVIGPQAQEEIRKLKVGEILVLDNLRLCSEENIEASAEKLLKTIFVQRLSPLMDIYVNDAFATAHRSQASLVAFPEIVLGVAGKTMEKELKILDTILKKPKRPCLYLLSGAKVKDRIKVIEYVLKTGNADKILVGGLLAEIFLKAKGYKLGVINEEKLKKYLDLLDKAKTLLETYKDKIVLPKDLALNKNGERLEVSLENTPFENKISDLGSETVELYSNLIKDAGLIVAAGPPGIFETKPFDWATKKLLEAMVESKAYKILGGGHLGGAAEILGLKEKFTHISTGGGAMLTYLSGQKLPAVEALKRSAKKFKKNP